MRHSLEFIKTKIDALGNDIEEKDIDLRRILIQILFLLDQALPIEVEPDW